MKYLAKKLAGFVMTMLVVSFLVFAAFAVIPGDPATAMLGTQATPEKLAALREQMGLNEPFLFPVFRLSLSAIQPFYSDFFKSPGKNSSKISSAEAPCFASSLA